MSTTTNDNDESTEDASDQKKKKEQSSSISTRRLNSFGIPDLEVLIGPKQRIYRYHALFLASYSMYVDTILSSPMTSAAAAATNSDDERPLRRIVFEDIEEDTWEIMISYLEPSSRFDPVKLADLERILPFYDKYQFVDGISLCDSAISYNLQTKHYTPLDGYETFRPERFVPIAVLAYHLNLPLSKKHAIAWASEVLKTMTPNSEDTITKLLPLVENDDTVLISLVKTIRGRHYTDMTMDEMRVLTQSESFARDVLLKTKQIEDLEQVLRDLHGKGHLPCSERGDTCSKCIYHIIWQQRESDRTLCKTGTKWTSWSGNYLFECATTTTTTTTTEVREAASGLAPWMKNGLLVDGTF